MNATFLEVDGICTEKDAAIWSVNAALQRNRVYAGYERREEFRAQWIELLQQESQRYRSSSTLSDMAHCGVLESISDRLSNLFKSLLVGGRLRYGTSQKAFNLYLKYLWHLKQISEPPHCPVDRIVLDEIGVDEAWTKCDDGEQYMRWIDKIRARAYPFSIARWEDAIWLRQKLAR